MPRPSARARGYMEAGNHGKRVPLPQKHQCFHPPRGPPQARKTARSRCCRIARLTAAPPASAATLLAPASRAQPPITAPNQDLRRGSSGVEKVLLGQQGARRASAGCAMGRGGAPGVGGGPGAAGAGRQRGTFTFPHLGAPPRHSTETSGNARRPAAEARRDLGAASAAGHLVGVRVQALPAEAGDVVHVLAVASQLRCAETGRPATGRRPASLSMAAHAASRAPCNRLRCRGRVLSQVKRGKGC
jgi:hypothetical protein